MRSWFLLAATLTSAPALATDVMVIYAVPDPNYARDVHDKLAATGRFATVDVWDAAASTPTPQQLAPYDAVLIMPDTGFLAGMAVRDHHNVGNARCVAALLSGIFHMLENIYAEAPLEFLFANPTTYTGNRLIMRLGFTPISYRKIKMGGMDLYMLVLTEERRAYFKNLQQRYARFVSSMDWMTS